MEKLFLKFVARAWKSLAVSLNCLIGLGNGLYIFAPCTSLTKKKKENTIMDISKHIQWLLSIHKEKEF